MGEDDWTARDEAADEARWEQRQEYAQDLYEERQRRRAHYCPISNREADEPA